jgi:hypothetical protein
MRINFAICCIMVSILASHGAEFDLGTRGQLSVVVPDGWEVNGKTVDRPNGTSIGYTFVIRPHNEVNAKCLLSIAYLTNGIPNKEIIRQDVLRICEEFVEHSVEKKKNLKEFSLEKGYGAYCVFTDALLVGKIAPLGNYKVMGSGEVQPADNMRGVVTIFADDADGKEFNTMVNVINSLTVKPKETK